LGVENVIIPVIEVCKAVVSAAVAALDKKVTHEAKNETNRDCRRNKKNFSLL